MTTNSITSGHSEFTATLQEAHEFLQKSMGPLGAAILTLGCPGHWPASLCHRPPAGCSQGRGARDIWRQYSRCRHWQPAPLHTKHTKHTAHITAHITAHYKAFLNESVCIMQGFILHIQVFLVENKHYRCSNTTVSLFLTTTPNVQQYHKPINLVVVRKKQ